MLQALRVECFYAGPVGELEVANKMNELGPTLIRRPSEAEEGTKRRDRSFRR